jgi:hypothetical protein
LFLSKDLALLQMISGIGFLIATVMLYMDPAFEQIFFSLPQLLSLLFLLAQAMQKKEKSVGLHGLFRLIC